MTTAPAVLLPGGRVLLSWWRELAPVQPQRLWFASLLLSRLEALVERTDVRPLDQLHQGILRALLHSNGTSLSALQLDPALETALLDELVGANLLQRGNHKLSAEGQTALARGAIVRQGLERKTFYFLEGTPARYLPLLRPAGTPIPLPEGWKFDPAVLETCLRQPEAWKLGHLFPTDVDRLVRSDPGVLTDWNEVIVVGPEQLLLALVQVPSGQGENRLLGFVAQSEGWTLDTSAPVLALPDGWREVLPGLADDPPLEEWKKSWQSWCQPRSLPAAEVEACQLELVDHRLLVKAPAKLVEKLRAARSDALKGEAWLLAGTGRSRAAALIEVIEA